MWLPWLNITVTSYVDLIYYIIGRNKQAEESSPSTTSWGSRLFGWGRSAPAPPRGAEALQSMSRPPLWAVIIGINDYHESSKMAKLSGAVPDADSINDYLQSELKVPSSQIRNLRDKQATRAGIIAAFEWLRDLNPPDFKPQDPILIYYAGHGGEVPTKGVQTLIPVDYIPDKQPPIPDRTVAALINQIAKKQGNNITVILDCCHSGSGARGDEDETTTVRGGELHPNDAPEGLDSHIVAGYKPPQPTGGTRGIKVAKGFANQDMNSHVLLAACSANELAKEDKKDDRPRGRFTGALLELFRNTSPDQITYFEVLTRMPKIDDQNPQVEGFHQKRIFFDAKVLPPTRHTYEVNIDSKGRFIVEAGRAHGITDGAEFTVYKNKESVPDSPLGKLVAQERSIKPFTTIFLPNSEGAPKPFEGSAIAIQTKVGALEDLKIHVPLETQYLPVFEAVARELDGAGPELCRIKLVENKAEAKLGIVAEGNKQVAFNVLETRATDYGFTRMPYTVDCVTDDLHRVLRAASHYHLHLNLEHFNNKIKEGIKIEFYALEDKEDEYGEDYREPVGPDLYRDGKVEIDVDDETRYGMKITNSTPFNLHFACFFFDHADFSITALNEMAAKTAYRKDPPLLKGASAEMGYGRLGIPPFQCDVPGGLDLAVGFLKFYFTEEPVDLSHIPQISPFTGTRGVAPSMDRKNPAWGTVIIPVVLKV
ncbi:hypothetical protein D9611_001450 [Ephemerocybe angulata]|uniref:Peptidase C14 caspase domain-containing protein n=1 Tax=Ephemerocybe angulata TaxID=980116 RepID=A0A8H5FM42_9AGAR|nr:hypothetical protein D9611_001450 [Tulosesus angulatus]